MPASTIVTGMVLSAMPVGDYDKRLVVLTKEIGKISVFAKGARKPNSALLACSQPFAFGEFTLYAGKSSYNIMSVEISNYFGELRDDYDRLCYGFYFCEFADYLTRENNDEKEILKLLYQSLRALGKNTINVELIRAIYELKIISLNGEAPQVFDCVKCDKNSTGQALVEGRLPSGKYYFSAASGGILCEHCRGFDKSAQRVNTSTLYALQYIIASDTSKLYTFKVTDDVLGELKACIKHYLKCLLEYEFRSLEMLNPV